MPKYWDCCRCAELANLDHWLTCDDCGHERCRRCKRYYSSQHRDPDTFNQRRITMGTYVVGTAMAMMIGMAVTAAPRG